MPIELPQLVDTHCHFEGDPSDKEVLAAAQGSNVTVIAVGGSVVLNSNAEKMGCAFTQGFDWSNPTVEPHPLDDRIVAVGELGFDLHYEQGSAIETRQRDTFMWQAEIARQRAIPVIIHTREADDLTLGVLREVALPKAGVIHSFTGSIDMARACLDMGYYISISGIVTFRNASALRDVAKFIPLDRILVETDSPYLAPVPRRGERNQPANVRLTADFIAGLRGLSTVEFAHHTTNNAIRLFNLKGI